LCITITIHFCSRHPYKRNHIEEGTTLFLDIFLLDAINSFTGIGPKTSLLMEGGSLDRRRYEQETH
jgi:hypothetical protein